MGEADTRKRDPDEEQDQTGKQTEGQAGEKAEKEAEEEPEEKLGPSVEVEDLGHWKRRIRIEVAAEKVTAEYEKQLKELSHTAQVPGFRKGRAPRKLLLNRFGEALEGDVKMHLLTKSLEEGMETIDLEAVSEPLFGPEVPPAPEAGKAEGGEKADAAEGAEEAGKAGEAETGGKAKKGEEAEKPPTPSEASQQYLKDLKLGPEEAFAFELTVEVKPTFDLPEYEGLKLTRRTKPVTDEAVERFLTAVRRGEADYEPVEEGEIEPGDRLTVAASMECEGEAVWEAESEIAHVTESALLGLPGIVKYAEVEGMRPGDEKTFDVKVVDAFQKEELRGKDARLAVRIDEAKRPVVPPLNDEAAKRLGAPDAETLRQQARMQLEKRAGAESRDDLERQIADALVGAVDFELPQGMLERQSQRQEIRQMLRLAQMGVPPDALEDEHRESIKQAARESTDRSLKLGLILGRIADAEKIEVTDDDLEDEIYRYAVAQRRTPVSVRSELERTGRLDDMRSEMLTAKVVNFVVEQADKTDAQEDPAAGNAAETSEGGAQ